MDVELAQEMALNLGNLHHVSRNDWRDAVPEAPEFWSFVWDDRELLPSYVQGVTMFDRSAIVLNQPFVILNDEPIVREVIIHELAHTKVDPLLDEDHGPVWQAMAYSMGAEISVPLGRMPAGVVKSPEPTFQEQVFMLLDSIASDRV